LYFHAATIALTILAGLLVRPVGLFQIVDLGSQSVLHLADKFRGGLQLVSDVRCDRVDGNFPGKGRSGAQ